jgi:hypothetical protein
MEILHHHPRWPSISGGAEMIFKQWEQVLDGSKTQTRRLVKPRQETNRWDIETDIINEVIQWLDNGKEYPSNMRGLYVVGHTYAVQPPGKKAVGRIRITKIRREQLKAIHETDCLSEGIVQQAYQAGIVLPFTFLRFECPACETQYEWAREAYRCLWNDIYGARAWDRMKDDDVWAIDFKLVEGLERTRGQDDRPSVR